MYQALCQGKGFRITLNFIHALLELIFLRQTILRVTALEYSFPILPTLANQLHPSCKHFICLIHHQLSTGLSTYVIHFHSIFYIFPSQHSSRLIIQLMFSLNQTCKCHKGRNFIYLISVSLVQNTQITSTLSDW